MMFNASVPLEIAYHVELTLSALQWLQAAVRGPNGCAPEVYPLADKFGALRALKEPTQTAVGWFQQLSLGEKLSVMEELLPRYISRVEGYGNADRN